MKFEVYSRFGGERLHIKIAKTVPKILIEMDDNEETKLLSSGLNEVLDFFSKTTDAPLKTGHVSLMLRSLERNRKRVTEHMILKEYQSSSLAIEDFIYVSTSVHFLIYNSVRDIEIDPSKLINKLYRLIDPSYKPGFTLILLWALWKNIGVSR